MGTLQNINDKNSWLTLVFASLFLVSLGMISQNAFADGPEPGSCSNEYDGPFTSFIINNGTQTFDAIANPGVTFDVNNLGSYTVTFVIHTRITSSQGNSDPGTTWYESTAYGYGLSTCASGAGPNQDVTISEVHSQPANLAPTGLEPVEFSTAVMWNGINFNVNWVNPPSQPPGAGVTVQSVDQNNNPIYGIYTLLCSQGTSTNADGSNSCETGTSRLSSGNTTVTFSGLPDGQTFGVDVYNNTACSFNHWSDNTANTYKFRLFTATNPPQVLTAVYSCSTTAPQPPTGLTATAQILQINLSWNAPSDNGGTPITGYMIERSTNNGSTWSTLVSNTGSTGTTYSDKNVLPLTTYTYRVSAINNIGTGNPSNTASAPIASIPALP